MNNQLKILLLDGHTVQAFSVLRSLKKPHFHLTIFCEKKISYGYTSKYPDKKIICPSITSYPDNFYNFLISFLKKNKVDFILPLYDESADFLNTNRNVIEKLGTKIGLPSKIQYDLARNKGLLMEFCKKNNIPHPKTCSITKTNFENVAEEIGFPSLLKPDKSSGAVGIVHVSSISQLYKYFSVADYQCKELSLQEFVDHAGYYFNAMLYRKNDGTFSKAVIVKICRYFPINGGTGSYNETVDNPEIEKISREILNKLSWNGFADLDFIVDKHTLKPKLIEINPRIPACIHSAFVSGINFPEIIIYDSFGILIPNQKYIAGKKVRFFAMDVLWFFFSNKRFHASPSWFRFFEKNLYYQDGSWDDPFTMLAGIVMGIRKYMKPSYFKSKLKNV